MEKLKSEDLGRAGMLLGGGEVDDSSWPGLPDGRDLRDRRRRRSARAAGRAAHGCCSRSRSSTRSPTRVTSSLLAPDVTAVTRDGDVLGAHFAAGGSTSKQSLIEVQAAIDQAEQDLADATHTIERLRFELATGDTTRVAAQQRVDAALAGLHESDATMAAVAEKLGHLGADVAGCARRGRAPERRDRVGGGGDGRRPVRPGRAGGSSGPGRGRHPRRSPTPGCWRSSPSRRRRTARPRPRHGWRCAPTKSGPARWPVRSRRCSRPPRPSGPPASGQPSGASASCARPRRHAR